MEAIGSSQSNVALLEPSPPYQNFALLECSPGAFRRRWDAILATLKVGTSSGLTQGGVRGGGFVYAFQTGVSLPTILWRMRIEHIQTLESYLQEVVASTVVSELPKATRDNISHAAMLAPFFMQALPLRKPFAGFET